MRAPWLFHGDPASSVGWRRGPPDGSAFVVFDPAEPLVHPSELDGPEVYIPEAIVDFFEADVLAPAPIHGSVTRPSVELPAPNRC